jgi:hypothetical protein
MIVGFDGVATAGTRPPVAPLDIEAGRTISSTSDASAAASPRPATPRSSARLAKTKALAAAVLNSPRAVTRGIGNALAESADYLLEILDGEDVRPAPSSRSETSDQRKERLDKLFNELQVVKQERQAQESARGGGAPAEERLALEA